MMSLLRWVGVTLTLAACGNGENAEERLVREVQAAYGAGVQVTVSVPARRIILYLEGPSFTGLSDSLMDAMGREIGGYALARYARAGDIDSVNARFIVAGRGAAPVPRVLRFPVEALRRPWSDSASAPLP